MPLIERKFMSQKAKKDLEMEMKLKEKEIKCPLCKKKDKYVKEDASAMEFIVRDSALYGFLRTRKVEVAERALMSAEHLFIAMKKF